MEFLVQGPPGTGKSHTIANLTCHLLATGRRILVTAKTPRALKVLEGLLPEEIRPLCINLLGEGLEEKQSLESSISGVLRKTDQWSKEQSQNELKELEQKLRELREEKTQIERRLRAIRESEIYPQTIGDGKYRGTAAKIARDISTDKELHEWFKDDVEIDKPCPGIQNDRLRNNLLYSINMLRKLTPDFRKELDLAWPNNLPAPDVFANLIHDEINAAEQERKAEHDA